ncbi:MAG: cytochrome b/b6 domain-containing protein, partial [Pseudomonadota bacterium]|nr:cytochrome b/b6 domain-containing protein [Pseudomonadota bacterium]
IALGVMIASGWAKSTSSGYTPNFYGLFELPMPFIPVSDTIKDYAKEVHLTTVWIIIGLISAHILAALHHHFIDKDNVLRRMLPFIKNVDQKECDLGLASKPSAPVRPIPEPDERC